MAHDPPRVKHNFVLPAFSYEQPPNTQPYIRINMFFMKRKDISWEYFDRPLRKTRSFATLNFARPLNRESIQRNVSQDIR